MSQEKLYEYVKVDDNTPVQKLSVGDQIRMLVNKLTYDPTVELKITNLETEAEMRRKANLLEFIEKSTDSIRSGEHHSVLLDVSSKFASVLDEVLLSPRIHNFYKVTVQKPHVDYDIPYRIKVMLEVRGYA